MSKIGRVLLITLFIAGLSLISLFFVNTKVLVIEEAESGDIIWEQVIKGKLTFAIKYLHSVERTPVWEYFKVDEGQLFLTGTQYESYGAGLPFLNKNNYIVDDGKFIIEDINRKLDQIPLRVSDYAKHRFIVNGKEYKLYKMTLPKKLVIIKIKAKNKLEILSKEGIRWLRK